MRLQFFPLIDAILSTGKKAIIHNIHSEQFDIKKIFSSEKIFVFKLAPAMDRSLVFRNALQLISKAKRSSVRLDLFYADNYVEINGDMSELYRELAKLSSSILSHSELLYKELKSINPTLGFFKISDPSLLRRQPFDFDLNSERCRILWFGQGENIKYLLNSLEGLFAQCSSARYFELKILTRKDSLEKVVLPYLDMLKKKTIRVKPSSSWKILLEPWEDINQPCQLERLLGEADISFLPSDPSDPWKVGASTNRIIDSIQSGCITVASQLPSYKQLKSISLLGSQYPQLVDYAWENRISLSAKYSLLRDDLLQRFSRKQVQRKWEDFVVN